MQAPREEVCRDGGATSGRPNIIRASFRWRDYHLYEFVVGERVYGAPTEEDAFSDRKSYKAVGIRLKTLVKRGTDRCLHVYDFGEEGNVTINL